MITSTSKIEESPLDEAAFRVHIRSLMSKDTSKAIVIIVLMLCVLVALLTWANHIRPH